MKRFLILLVTLIIGVFAFLFYRNFQIIENNPIPSSKEAPATTTNDVEPQPNEEVAQATLNSVGSFTGSATATTSWSGTEFIHAVEAQLPDPPADKFYEGWLVQPNPLDFFSTGKLELVNGNYSLEFSDSSNYPNHTQVVITLETLSDGLDNNPEAHVLEGYLDQ